MKAVADGLVVAHKPYKGIGKIAVVGEGKKAAAITRNDNRFAFEDTVDRGIAVGPGVKHPGDGGIAVGVAGAYNGNGKVLVYKGLVKNIFAGNFILGVGPIGVCPWGALGHNGGGRGLLVHRSAGEHHVLPAKVLKKCHPFLGLAGGENNKIADYIKGEAG